jgi:hypothetical protein
MIWIRIHWSERHTGLTRHLKKLLPLLQREAAKSPLVGSERGLLVPRLLQQRGAGEVKPNTLPAILSQGKRLIKSSLIFFS